MTSITKAPGCFYGTPVFTVHIRMCTTKIASYIGMGMSDYKNELESLTFYEIIHNPLAQHYYIKDYIYLKT